jgi:23S rRNA (uracil1939-C5)-methyltransferase
MLEVPVKHRQQIKVKITGYGHEGEGVGRFQDFTVFIAGALQGESIWAEITEVRKNFARADIVDILEKSPERAEPRCPIYSECGGCQLQHMSYTEQLAMKQQRVLDALEHIGGTTGVTIHPVLGMAEPWRYRNKAQFPYSVDGTQPIYGFYRRKTHQIVPVTDCLLQPEATNRIAVKIHELVRKFRVPVYDENFGAGLLRHLLIKRANRTGETMIVFITNGERFPEGVSVAYELTTEFPEITSVIQNVNTSRGNVILGEETRVLTGEETIQERLGSLRFDVSARSFFQVNPVQTEALFAKAVEFAGLTGGETVLDAYSGVGSLSLFLARRAARVIGIESIPEAVADAKANATLNRINNAEFRTGAVEKVLPDLTFERIHFDVAVVDPPRSGCDPAVLQSFAEHKIARIVYVSCDPGTLARDLKLLGELGYKTLEVQPVDMFPQTYHIECVASIALIP